jgi:oligoribonuclease NrnB/cAMP/cGMP phosphodiesterase (DHH superfamily)
MNDQPNDKVLCIYHGNCADGFGAALAVHLALGDRVELLAGKYQEPLPSQVDGRDVVLVDFSYRREQFRELKTRARSVLVLDHHASAVRELAEECIPIGSASMWEFALRTQRELCPIFPDPVRNLPGAAFSVFDLNRSGAVIAWEFFHPGEAVPLLFQHIQDRDLWRFQLQGTREIQAALFSHPYELESWTKLVEQVEFGDGREKMIAEGTAIERKHFKDVRELIVASGRLLRIGGYVVPAANLPYTMASDACEEMAHGNPFAVCYMDGPKGRSFSLRSIKGGVGAVDVSVVAAQYGGGGHPNAAGFKVPFSVAAEFELP